MKQVFYKIAANNKVKFWSIESHNDEVPLNSVIKVQYGEVGRTTQTEYIDVRENRSSRYLKEQCNLEIQSRINKKKDAGYCDTVEKAIANKGKNASGLPRPMLAKKWNPEKPPDMKGACVQYKYDGHRCIIYNDGERNRAYSRNGKPIESTEHILSSMELLPSNAYLDGELYVHRMPLQKITSLVKKPQYESINLRFIAYDIMLKDLNYDERVSELGLINLGLFAGVAPCWFGLSVEDLPTVFRDARDAGYEGLIIRLDGYGYEAGKRHKQLLKMKEFLDDEFEVVGVASSVKGWAVLECLAKNGELFSVTAPGAAQDKIHVLRNKEKFIGKYIRVEYANLTQVGIPFHPVAVGWRDKGNE